MTVDGAGAERLLRPRFGDLLKQLRSAADFTQEELAERAGVSARLISDLERGVIQRPRRDTVRLLADGLGLSEIDRETFSAHARGQTPTDVADLTGSVGARAGNLLPPPTALIGRDDDIKATTTLLTDPATRLLTLVGPGGVGKTGLALVVAAQVVETFPQGVWFVDLSPLTNATMVIPAIARTLGLHEQGERLLVNRLTDALQGQQLLIVLDNVEHLMGAVPEIGEILRACPDVTILATSRQPLRLRVEREYVVSPLALPDLTRLPIASDIASIPAVDLFVRRAEQARPSFIVTDENAHMLAEIAVRLDGLPLAIELAAARVKILSPAALLDRLEHRLPLLVGGARDLPSRQRTLQATLDWSYGLLTTEHQTLLRRLSIFAGGAPLDAAESVVGSPANVLDGIAALVDQSLLRTIAGEDDPPRFGMLETVREYGGERLRHVNEEAETRDRHTTWFLAFAERAEPELIGPHQLRWYRRLDAELDNLRAAFTWSVDREDAETAMRLTGALERFWRTRGLGEEGRRWIERSLRLSAPVPDLIRARFLGKAASIIYFQGDLDAATAFAEDALILSRTLDDAFGAAIALSVLANVAESLGDAEQTVLLAEEAQDKFQRLGEPARSAAMVNTLGLLAWRQRDYARSEALHEQSLALAREGGDRMSIARSLTNLGLVATDRGDYTRASRLQQESLLLQATLGNKYGLAHCFENIAHNVVHLDGDEFGVQLFSVADVLRTQIGCPSDPSDRVYNDQVIQRVRTRMGEAAFTSAWNVGRTLSLEEAITLALSDPSLPSVSDVPFIVDVIGFESESV